MAKRHIDIINAIRKFGLVDDHTGEKFESRVAKVAGIYESSRISMRHPELGGSPVIALTGCSHYSINEVYLDDAGVAHVSRYGCGIMYPELMDNNPRIAMAKFNANRDEYETEVGIKVMHLLRFYPVNEESANAGLCPHALF